jgi:hypothetical protein
MNKSENYAHFSSTLKSLFSLSRKHETKNKHRERRVEEATNLWRTWMGEILTNLGKNGSTSPITGHEREEELGYGRAREEGAKDCQMKWRAGDVVSGINGAS